MRMDKETSLALLQLEKEGAKQGPKIMSDVFDVVEKEIENDRLTYEEFINVFIEVFQQNVPEEADESTVEVREELVNKICQSIIDKYEQGNEE